MKNLWMWFTHKLLGIQWVWLIDYNGAMNSRRVINVGACKFAKRVGFGIRTVELYPDGTLGNGSYVVAWKPLYPHNLGGARSSAQIIDITDYKSGGPDAA